MWQTTDSQTIVRSKYGKYPLNPQKIATKGFSTDSGRFWCTFQHTKSLGKSNPRKCVFFKMASNMAAETFFVPITL